MACRIKTNILKNFLLFGLISFICACIPVQDNLSKKSSKKTSQKAIASPLILQGNFIDSAVSGIEYTSGEISGVTDSTGLFQYQEGKKIKFKVGDILLGEVDGAKTVTPITLVDNSNIQVNINTPKVTNIVRFLLTLDDDNDPSNGIKLNDSVRANSKNKTINFDQPTSSFESSAQNNVDLIKGGSTTITTSGDAQIHLSNTLSSLPPEAPRGLVGFPESGKISLSWDNVESASSYNLYYSRIPHIGVGNQFNPFNTIKIPNIRGPYLLNNQG